MTPREFLDIVVRPDIADFIDNYGDIRLGYNATAAVDSLMAHIFEWCRDNAPTEISDVVDDSAFRHELVRRLNNEDLSLLVEVAKCQKHVRLTRGTPSVTTATQIKTRSLGWGQARWGEGRWGGPPQVSIETNNGNLRVLETVLTRALEAIELEMGRLGV